jgi:hypothetical protein
MLQLKSEVCRASWAPEPASEAAVPVSSSSEHAITLSGGSTHWQRGRAGRARAQLQGSLF